MAVLKKLVLPPLLPLVVLFLLCGWVMTEEVAIINGRPDNAPRRAAVIIVMVCPLFYVFFALLNLIDAALDRLHGNLPWAGTFALILGFGMLCSYASLGAEPDTGRYLGSITFGLGLSVAILLPMAVVRRYVLGKRPAPHVKPAFLNSKAWSATDHNTAD